MQLKVIQHRSYYFTAFGNVHKCIVLSSPKSFQQPPGGEFRLEVRTKKSTSAGCCSLDSSPGRLNKGTACICAVCGGGNLRGKECRETDFSLMCSSHCPSKRLERLGACILHSLLKRFLCHRKQGLFSGFLPPFPYPQGNSLDFPDTVIQDDSSRGWKWASPVVT